MRGLKMRNVAALACAALLAMATIGTAEAAGLTPFQSDAQIKAYLKKMRKAQPPLPPPAPGATAEMATAAAPQAVTVTASRTAGASITNNQEAGVDEGDIVKMHGEVMVILRRGRIFTVSLKDGGLRPVDSIEAYPPGANARYDWYDEMLVTGNRVIVIGYSYGRGGTEINRFKIDDAGKLAFEDSYHLRSNDYYSSRNYASRLIGTHLIVYSPLYLPSWVEDPFDHFPALSRWNGEKDSAGTFVRTASAQHIYMPPRVKGAPEPEIEALHTVTDCDLSKPVLSCKSQGVLGGNGRNFYVSSNAVYVWVSPGWGYYGEKKGAPSYLYRLPLDGSAPSAIAAHGAPADQFSFREDTSRKVLNVLVRADSAGDAMWAPEKSEGAIALVTIPLSSFGRGDREIARAAYRALPEPKEDGSFQNRFAGSYVLYGNGASWGRPDAKNGAVTVVPVAGGAITTLPLGHGVDRIDLLGPDGIVIGSDDHNVYFTAIELGGNTPRIGDRYTQLDAAQAETRSHAFFFKPEDALGSGVLGLPVAREARPGYKQLFENSAAMVFLRRANRKFIGLGELDASSEGIRDDNCQASCVDWYGNARPIFLGKRTFALLGYEIVEGEVQPAAIREVRRVSFAPESRKPSPRP